jgi:hypothetical protein
MSLNPVDLRVEKLSEDVALVTFHLVDGNTLNRRTLVFKRDSMDGRLFTFMPRISPRRSLSPLSATRAANSLGH